MNLKKLIKLKNEEQGKDFYSEEERELYNSLFEKVQANAAAQSSVAAKKKFKISQVLSALAPVAIALAITLTCIFTIPLSSSDILYSDDDIEHNVSTYDDLQFDLKYVNIFSLQDNINQVLMAYDKKSNDKLYYELKADINLSSAIFVIVINEKFNYKFNILNETTVELENYSLTYHKSQIDDISGLPNTEYRGYIQVQTETVYFDYIQVPALGDEAFFDSIQEIIQVK